MGDQLFARPRLTERVWLLRVLRAETVGGIIMLLAAVVALVWANSPAVDSYVALTSLEFGPKSLHLHLPLSVWAADFLLAFFFYLAGVELKHEVQIGTLSNPAQAAVPVVAAAAGMAIPALLYAAVTWAGGVGGNGWGIPMATDIAFALAVLAIMGRGLPLALRAFLLTLAVVDDLGAIMVIALFYSQGFEAGYLGAAALLVGVWWVLQHRRFGGTAAALLVYLPLALVIWFLTHESGVHATVAGVALGLATRVTHDEGEQHSPGDRAEQALRPFVAGLAVPIFAFTSAGVTVLAVGSNAESVPALSETFTSPVAMGVIVGLVVGKPVGVIGGAWLMSRFTRASLNPALRWADIVAVGVLAGIGFTVSLLIAELAYHAEGDLLAEAKAGILSASMLAALLAALLLYRRRRAMDAYIKSENVDANNDGIPDVYQSEPGG